MKEVGRYIDGTGSNEDKLLREFKREAISFSIKAVRDFLKEMVFKPHFER